MAFKFMSPTFEDERKAYTGVEELYKSGGWVIGGINHYLADGNPGQKTVKPISGRRTANGITRLMLNLTVAGANGVMTIKPMTPLDLS